MRWWKLIAVILLCQIVGFLGSLFDPGKTWYSGLAKPSITPPSWVFGVVWTLLFVLMAVSLFLVWKPKTGRVVYIAFSLQLFLNVLWSAIFFGLRSPLLALVEIFILWASILWCVILFYKVDKNSAYLLIPYLLWVSFAIVLNALFVAMN